MDTRTFVPRKLLALSPIHLILAGLAFTALGWILVCLLHSAAVAGGETAEGGNAAHGETLFQKRCTGCHSLDKDKEGPRLRGVFGRKAGSIPSFKYSDAIKKSGILWDSDKLNQWLTDTDKLVPDNDMDFHVEKTDEREDIIAYLKSLSDKQ